MNNKHIAPILILLLISFCFNIFLLFKDSNRDINVNTEFSNISDNFQEENNLQKYTIQSALQADWMFDTFLSWIVEKFNYKELLLSEFEKVSTVAAFDRFEKKFWERKILAISLIDKNMELLSKYNSLQCESRKCSYLKEDLKKLEQEVISGFQSSNFFDGDIISQETKGLDQVFLAMSSRSSSEKADLCSQYLVDDALAAQKCKDLSYYISSFQENKNYCDKIEGLGFKRLCIDTYINK